MLLTAAARRIAHAVAAGFTAPSGVLDEDVLEELYADGQIDGTDYAYCPRDRRVTAHALHTDGSQSCHDCGHRLNGVS